MGHYWIVSLPLKHRETAPQSTTLTDEDRQILFSHLKEKLCVHGELADLYQLPMPEFKVGTLDALVTSSEELAKMDSNLESIINRLINNLRSLLADEKGKVEGNLVVSTPEGQSISPNLFVSHFQWNKMKYRLDKPIPEIAETILTEAQQIDNLLKTRLSAYNQVKSSLSAQERKNSGSLLTQDLSPYVEQGDLVDGESDLMQTLLVVVHKNDCDRWNSSYERLTDFVVPRSSRLLTEVGDHALYAVTIFVRAKDTFIKAAMAAKFTIREYKHDPQKYSEELKVEEALKTDEKAQWSSLVRLCKTNFGELFSASMHLKLLLLFVDSVLQYGLPAQFLFTILHLRQKDRSRGDRKVKQAICQCLEQLMLPGISIIDITAALHDSSKDATEESVEEAELWEALNMANQNTDPFVKVTVRVPLLEQSRHS